jgi:enoyl-CoA hydratase/carnithine racemase
MSSQVLFTCDRDTGVATIRFNRPEKKNALNAAMYAALGDAIEAAESDDAVRAILLCAAGENFTAGNDLADFASRPQDGSSPAQRFLYGIARAKKPLVAAVDGYAVGVGLTMLLHCDLVYASRRAKLRAPFVDLGLVPEAGSSLLLPRLVGHMRASEVFLLSEMISAERARELGIVNQVVDPSELEALALSVCRRLGQKAPGAVRRTKELLRDTSGGTVERMQREFALFAEQLRSDEARTAIASFFEKRPKE